MPVKLTQKEWWISVQKRLWAKIDVRGPDDCWLWTACTYLNGYGMFTWSNGIVVCAHRATFMIVHKRAVKPEMCILHKCDNKLCCNPQHLYEGTHANNMTDAIVRKRILAGSQYSWAKLDENKVRVIRVLHAQGFSQDGIAAAFGVARVTIGSIIREVTWKHVRA